MALTVLAHWSEARVAGADGAYTDQIVVQLPNNTGTGYRKLAHDLGRIPDWVRVTQLAVDSEPPAAYVKPLAKQVVDPGSLRYEWLETAAAETVDLANDIIVAVYNPNSDPAEIAYFLIELGITHSKAK